MKAVVVKPFLDGRNRAATDQVIEMEESRFSELAANGLVKALDGAKSTPSNPEMETVEEEKQPSEATSEAETKPNKRGSKK